MFNSVNIKTLGRCKLKIVLQGYDPQTFSVMHCFWCDTIFWMVMVSQLWDHLRTYWGMMAECWDAQKVDRRKRGLISICTAIRLISKYSWQNWGFFTHIHKEVNAFMKFWHSVIPMRSVKVKVSFWSKMGPPHAPPKMVVASTDVLSLNQMTCISFP
jgi:hypothetical protein